jgi:hypothetical protein
LVFSRRLTYMDTLPLEVLLVAGLLLFTIECSDNAHLWMFSRQLTELQALYYEN